MSDPALQPSTDAAAIQHIIANVLRVPLEKVQPDSDLVGELGAESIDFLDLLFNLDELVGRHVLPEHWGTWLKERLPPGTPRRVITPRIIEEFVVSYRVSAMAQPAAGEPQ
jgi:acyl carrier protein